MTDNNTYPKIISRPDNEDELLEMILNQPWTFAKTYVNKGPHEYFLRVDNEALYDALVEAIAEYGRDDYYFKHKYRYVDIGGYYYWHYQTLVNRRPRTPYTPEDIEQFMIPPHKVYDRA